MHGSLPAHPDRHDERWPARRTLTVGAGVVLFVAVMIAFPPSRMLGSVFGVDSAARPQLAEGALGVSGSVFLVPALPGASVSSPVAPSELGGEYLWVRASDSSAVAVDTLRDSATVRVPSKPGFYHLAVFRGEQRVVVSELVYGVMAPFAELLGGSINGYRIGTYRWQRSRDDATAPPPGFVEVWPADTAVWVSAHLQLADFITHDGQEQWPKYVALTRVILDKVELALDRLGGSERPLSVNVHSGFRTPRHNRRVPRAATDSRHQYGDAVDLALDADLDGRVSYFDILAIARAVEAVERDYPQFVGGLGVYGNRGNAPYVHIDARGERKRWRG